jgi:hypothetical protein
MFPAAIEVGGLEIGSSFLRMPIWPLSLTAMWRYGAVAERVLPGFCSGVPKICTPGKYPVEPRRSVVVSHTASRVPEPFRCVFADSTTALISGTILSIHPEIAARSCCSCCCCWASRSAASCFSAANFSVLARSRAAISRRSKSMVIQYPVLDRVQLPPPGSARITPRSRFCGAPSAKSWSHGTHFKTV